MRAGIALALLLGLYLAVFAPIAYRNVHARREADFPAYKPHPKDSPSFRDEMQWLRIDLPKRGIRLEDAERIVAILDAGYPPELRDPEHIKSHGLTVWDLEPVTLWVFASSVAAEMIRSRRPRVDDAAIEIILEAWIARLSHDDPRVRSEMISNVVYSGLVAEPGVRALVESMASDPVPWVADRARRHLEFYDEEQRLRAEGLWRE